MGIIIPSTVIVFVLIPMTKRKEQAARVLEIGLDAHYSKGGSMIENMRPTFISTPSSPPSTGPDEGQANKFKLVPANTGEAYWVMGGLFDFLVTGEESGGSYFTLVVDVGPGLGPPPHTHHLEDEQFYVLEGQLTYLIGDRTFQLSTGDFIHIPRGTVHSFTNGPKHSRLLATFAPAGIEGFFREVGERVGDRSKAPPPVTEAVIARFVAAEAGGWKEHHDTLPPPSAK
jgi:quercetin dioxygenase-like cupin family protein